MTPCTQLMVKSSGLTELQQYIGMSRTGARSHSILIITTQPAHNCLVQVGNHNTADDGLSEALVNGGQDDLSDHVIIHQHHGFHDHFRPSGDDALGAMLVVEMTT